MFDVTGESASRNADEENDELQFRRVGDALLYNTYERMVALLSKHAARVEGVRSEIASLQQNDGESQKTSKDHSGDCQNDENMLEAGGEVEGTQAGGSDGSATNACAGGLVGGWPRGDHMLFAKAWRENVDRGKGHGAFRKQLSLLLPHISRDEITSHSQWFERLRFLQRQMREERARWERTCADALRQAGEDFRSAVRESVELESKQAAWSKTKKAQSVLHDKLAKMREVFEARRAEEEALEMERAREAEDARQKERKVEEARRARERAEIEGFRNEKLAAAEREAEKQQAALEEAEQKAVGRGTDACRACAASQADTVGTREGST